jgi:hypothetical protein
VAIDPRIREIPDFDVRRALRHSFIVVVPMLWAMLGRGLVFLDYNDFLFVLVLVLVLVMSMPVFGWNEQILTFMAYFSSSKRREDRQYLQPVL